MTSQEHQELIDKINKLKKEKNARLLVHNYQRPEIYEVADFMGDSLELARKAIETDANIIVFCGVDFMAESAKILNPEKKVLHPSKLSVCPMAQMGSKEKILELKKQYPDAAIVSYVNTTADVKAISDICCTSANSIQVVNSLEQDTVIFAPDKHIATYTQTKSDKKIIPVDGHCYVHDKITPEHIIQAKKNYPNAKIMAHPECRMEVLKLVDAVCSTSQMIKYAGSSDAKEFIAVTECGMADALKKEFPDKNFYAVGGTCIQMKKITLENTYDCLLNETNEIILDEDIIKKAQVALQRMIDLP